MERLLGTIIFSNRQTKQEEHRIWVYQRRDGSFFRRETWQASVDQEEGFFIPARSTQVDIARSDARSLCMEFFRRDPENCWCEFFSNLQMNEAEHIRFIDHLDRHGTYRIESR